MARAPRKHMPTAKRAKQRPPHLPRGQAAKKKSSEAACESQAITTMGIGQPHLGARLTLCEESLEGFEEKTKWVMLGLSLLVIPSLALPYLLELTPAQRMGFRVFDWALWAAFAAEYLWRLRLARERWRFVKRNPIDLVVLLLPVLRPLRFARFVRVFRVAGALGLVLRAIDASRRPLLRHPTLYALLISALVCVMGMIVVHEVESQHADSPFRSWSAAGRWTFETVVTAGSETSWPATEAGRIVRVILVLVGLGLFGLITASVASWLVEAKDEKHEAKRHEKVQQQLAGVQSGLSRMRRGDRRHARPRVLNRSPQQFGASPQPDAAEEGP